MKKKWICVIGFFALMMVIGWGILQSSLSHAGGSVDESQPQSLSAYDYTDQLIVKYHNPYFARAAAAGNNNAGMMINEWVNALSSRAGIALMHFRFMSGDGHVLKLPQTMTLAEATTVARRLAADPDVQYAEPDRRMYPMATPNDPLYESQWHYKAPADEIGGVNLPAAWDITTGSGSIVVAVIDTGIRLDHTDLVERTVPGYDFITDVPMANDGNGRDSDPSDPGDWVAANECGAGKPASNSSWHGTHVAGTIGASTNNGVGVAGINWASKILPVRVLGKCGGYTSDIAEGMRWAAGIAVSGVPANANPAKVLNLSLGGDGACDSTWQNAINTVTAAGATVVVAAGNDSIDASNFSPANCTGVITVAATDRTGGRASYSNYGAIVKIAAPGGRTTTTTNGVLSTLNTGTTIPKADSYQYYQGTSMATPHVSGIASLLLSINPTLTPAQVLTAIQSTARTFPTGTVRDCTTSTCGSGIIDAAAAVSSIVVLNADVAIEITDSPDPATVNNNLTYTITVSNSIGPDKATGVTVTDTLPAGVTYVSATPSQGTCNGTTTVTCGLGSINYGSSAHVTVIVTPTATAAALSNTATVTTVSTDATPGNNTATSTTEVNNPVPSITSLNPASAYTASGAFTLTVNGSKFVSGAQVKWNGSVVTTTFISANQLTAAIPATDIETAGTANVTVENPTPCSAASNTATFTINTPAPAAAAGGGGGCFIATAAFGSPMEKHVQILRDVRDRVLLNSSAGKAFVQFYYRESPAIAGKIAASDGLRLITRAMLMPIIGVAYLVVHLGILITMLLFTSTLLTFILTIVMARKKFLNQRGHKQPCNFFSGKPRRIRRSRLTKNHC